MSRKHAGSRAPRVTYKHFMTNPVDWLWEKLQRTIKIYPIAVHWDGSDLVSDVSLIPASITMHKVCDERILPHNFGNRPIEFAPAACDGFFK